MDQCQMLGRNFLKNYFLCIKIYVLENYIELLKLILPEILIEYFDVTKSEKKSDQLHLYFEEKNNVPSEYAKRQLISKGFHSEITIQDFPLRGKFVFLHIKRRRWTDKETNEIVQRDWKEVAEGTRLTHEFASFLKEINRY
jgi:hypothetical protein